MNFQNAIENYFSNWANFKSRASRPEYWWAIVFVFFGFPFAFAVAFQFGLSLFTSIGFSTEEARTIMGTAGSIFLVFLIISLASLSARRLHDADKAGWWFLAIFTIIALPLVISWLCSKGTEGENRFGSDPLGQSPAQNNAAGADESSAEPNPNDPPPSLSEPAQLPSATHPGPADKPQ
ncbi:MAG: DUF805 domain-containing protein [Gammaproteobacteria bacterium AqS3]|nr:DUF805 domain-containing protein [Gammaproteobacteria bacterium AqS3]